MQSRWLGASGRGQVVLLINLVFLALTVADFGFTATLPYHAGRRNEDPGVVYGTFLGWSACSMIAVFVSMSVCAWLIPSFESAVHFERFAPVIAVMMIVTQVANFLQIEALSLKKFNSYNALIVICQSVMPLLMLTVYLLHRTGISVALVVVCYTAGNAAEICLGLCLGKGRVVKQLARLSVSLTSLRARLGVGVKAFASRMIEQILNRADVFLIFFILRDARSVGVYSIAVLLLTAWTAVPGWAALTILPKAAHDDPGIAALTVKLCYWAVALAGVGAVAYILLGPVLSRIFVAVLGSSFHSTYRVFLFLLPRALLAGPCALIGSNLAGKGFTLYHPLSSFAGLIVSVVLMLALVPGYHLSGAAVATSAGSFCQVVVLLVGFCRVNAFSFKDLIMEAGNVRLDAVHFFWLLLGRKTPAGVAND
jgi:O-antigen/teichoic acid export membrane protein